MTAAASGGNRALPVRRAAELNALRLAHQDGRRADGRFVLYWMQQQRRLQANRALAVAIDQARARGLPLVILEDLLCAKPWANDRHHAFAARGMGEHAAALAGSGVAYLAAVESADGDCDRLLRALLAEAAAVVSDEVPCHVVPACNRRLADLARTRGVPVTLVDDNGLMPIRLLVEPCPSAAVFRRYVHKHAAEALRALPPPRPLARAGLPPVPAAWIRRWRRDHPCLTWLDRFRADDAAALTALPIDHAVPPVPGQGGRRAARRVLRRFLDEGLWRYDRRNDPAEAAASGLSPYLHWGHIGAVEILQAVLDNDEEWDIGRLPAKGGRREGFWPLTAPAQAFLDQLLVWRELGFHAMALEPRFIAYATLPEWAKATLAAHADDPRPTLYEHDRLEAADTGDALWNAAQRQLRREGVIHNYLRMLWGKKVLEWSPTPQRAYESLVELNNRWALDGRDPNSWSGIRWCFGCFDHPWQERAVFGTVRCMTSASTRRKFDLTTYLERYG